VPLPGEIGFFKTYSDSNARKLADVLAIRRDYPIRLGSIMNSRVTWDDEGNGGTFDYSMVGWATEDAAVDNSITKRDLLALTTEHTATTRTLESGKNSFRVLPMVVPLDTMRTTGEGWAGNAFTYGANWLWQPAAWPAVNLRAVDAIARCELGKDAVATGESFACSTTAVIVTCEFVGDRKMGAAAVAGVRIWRARGTIGVSDHNSTDRVVAVYQGMKFVCGSGLFEVVSVSATKLGLRCHTMSPSLNWGP